MRLALSALLLVLSLLPPAGFPSPADAAGNCQFVLGFKTLHDLIPDIVGDCLVNEHHNPDTGDALQETTGVAGRGGLLVWRKADNWTAYTDGYRTWVNGPFGLQSRLNTARFPWESAPTTAACDLSGAVALGAASPAPDGSAFVPATLRNPCQQPVDAAVDVFATAPVSGQPVVDAPTVFVDGLAPGEARQVTARVPRFAPGGGFTDVAFGVSSQPAGTLCIDVGASRCLVVDRRLGSAVAALRGLDAGRQLLQTAADSRVQVLRGQLAPGVLGVFDLEALTVTLSTRLDQYSSWVRAAVLAHELQHATDAATGQPVTTTVGCFRTEERAFLRESQVWAGLWRNRLPPDVDAVHAELNDVTLTIARDPAGFVAALVRRYRAECG